MIRMKIAAIKVKFYVHTTPKKDQGKTGSPESAVHDQADQDDPLPAMRQSQTVPPSLPGLRILQGQRSGKNHQKSEKEKLVF